MTYPDPLLASTKEDTGDRWLAALQAAGAAQDVVSIRRKLRDAEDGTSELWAVVVLLDEVALLPATQRRVRLKRLEDALQRIMLNDGYDAVPLVSFRTKADEAEQAAMATITEGRSDS